MYSAIDDKLSEKLIITENKITFFDTRIEITVNN